MRHNTLAHILTAGFLAICLLFAFTGCSKMENVTVSNESTTAAVQTVTNEAGEVLAVKQDGAEASAGQQTEGTPSDEDNADVTTARGSGVLSSNEEVEYYVPSALKNPGNRTGTLYIWSLDTYKTARWYYRDALTVQKLLEGIQHETNWDLTATNIKYDDQKITIQWAKTCSLYAGVPEKQSKDYLVYDQKDLDAAILDSVKKTIIENFGPSYTVCYGNATGGDLTLSGVGVTIPVSKPYSRFGDYTK